MFEHFAAPVNRSGVTALSQSNTCSGSGRAPLHAPLSRTPRWRPFFRDFALAALVVVVAVMALRGPAERQSFSIDESRWIATSRYFWITFLERDLFGPAWQPNYIVLTHPPVARYIIGFGLWAQGWTPDQLNGRYDSLESRAFNERAGNVPDDALLQAARRVTFVFAVLATMLLYGVARALGGPWAGLATAALTLVNPLLTTVWTRALAESIVAAFSLLTLLLALLVMPHAAKLGRLTWAPLVIGATLALAAATKLNGALGAVGLGAFAAVQQGLALKATRHTSGVRAWTDVAMTATVVFVLMNPLLYINPVERAIALYQHRQDEMQFQMRVFSDQAVPDDLDARVTRVARRAFGTWATPNLGLPISSDVFLVPLGLVVLLRRSAAELLRRWAGRPLLMLCWFAVTYAVVAVNLGFDSSHYYAPVVSLNMIVGGVAVATAGAWVADQLRRRWAPDRAPSQLGDPGSPR